MSNMYNYDIGKVYDTAFYITAYFRGEDFFAYLRNRFVEIDINEAMCGFFEFKERHKSITLSSEIEPFVYTDYQAGMHSFLIRAICDNVSFSDHTKDGVTSFLQNREMIKRLFWEHLFPQKKDQVAERIITNDRTLYVPDVIDTLKNIPENIKTRLVDMSHDFPKYQWKLIESFRVIYPLIEEYHSDNQSIIDEIKRQITDNLLERLRNIFKMPETVLTFPVYFSLLNGLLLDYRKHDGKVCFGLGQYFADVLDSLYSYDHISLNSFGKIVYVKTRSDMVDMFLDYKRLCASEIAHKLQVSRSTIYLHINAMWLEGIIKHTDPNLKNNGEKVYYSINPDYFKAYAGLSVDINQRAYNNISKGIDKYELPRKKRKARDGLIYNDNDEYEEDLG